MRLKRQSRSSLRRREARILVYGFGSYLQYRQNVTTEILRKLPQWSCLRKIVFPVRFDRRQFVAAVRTYQPDVILGLGQCSSGEVLRVENRAVNRRRTDRKSEARPILMSGAPSHVTTLDLKLGSSATGSNRAGDYVCNYSMYVLLDFLERQRLPVRFGFVHIPYDYDAAKAAGILLKRIVRIKRGLKP